VAEAEPSAQAHHEPVVVAGKRVVLQLLGAVSGRCEGGSRTRRGGGGRDGGGSGGGERHQGWSLCHSAAEQLERHGLPGLAARAAWAAGTAERHGAASGRRRRQLNG